MSEYSSETCYVCEFSQNCIKSYGNPHDGCTNKFKTKSKPMLNKPEQQVSVVDKDGDLEMLIEIARFEDKEEMKAFETVGWSWRHVRIWPATLERFWRLGYLDRKLNTSSPIGYRLNQKGRIRIYGEKPPKSEGQIEQEVLKKRLANVRRNTTQEIFKDLDELCRTNWMAVAGGGSHYVSVAEIQKIKEKYLK